MARPVPLDKRAIFDLASALQEAIRLKMFGLDEHRPGSLIVPTHGTQIGVPFRIRTVRGEDKTVYIRVVSGPGNPGHFIVGGGYGVLEPSGLPVIQLTLNTRIRPQVLWHSARHSDLIQQEAFAVLLHELTHAADAGAEYKRAMSRDEARDNLTVYLNEPSEVRAHMQEILHEIEPLIANGGFLKLKKHFGPTRAANMILSTSPTWNWASPHWAPKNRQKVVKSVAASLVGAGFSTGQTFP
jgi:hypothetical protein